MDDNLFNKNLTNSLIEAIGHLPNSENLLASLELALKLAQNRLQNFASDPDFDTKISPVKVKLINAESYTQSRLRR